MININLGDPNVVDNFKAVNELRCTGSFSDNELQDMYNKQAEADKIKSVEDQILAEDDNDSVTMDRATADALVTIAESVLICDVLTDDGELITAEVLQPTGSSWDELDKLLSAMHVIRWQCCDDNEYNMTKYAERVAKTHLNSLYGLSARAPHTVRMLDEYAELCDRLDKLCKYYDANSGLLDDKQRDLMCKQITVMRAYADILQQRTNYDIQYYSKEDM